MASRTSVSARFHNRTLRDVRERAASEGVSVAEFVEAAVLYALRHKEFCAIEYKEIQVSPRDGQPLDAIMDVLAARRMILADLIPRGQEQVSVRLRRTLRKVLSPQLANRFERHVLLGESLELIGQREGVSKQAVHTSVQRAVTKLRTSREFLDALVELFPEAGVSTDLLMEM